MMAAGITAKDAALMRSADEAEARALEDAHSIIERKKIKAKALLAEEREHRFDGYDALTVKDSKGSFAKGNKTGRGTSPFMKNIAKARALFFSVFDEDELMPIYMKLGELAKAGNMEAIRLIVDKQLGSPAEQEAMDRLNELEGMLRDALADQAGAGASEPLKLTA